MSARRAVWVVARREIRERATQKSFILSFLVTVLIVIGVSVAPKVLGSDGPERYTVAALDSGAAPVVEAARATASQLDLRVDVRDYPDAAAARRALSDQQLDAAVGGGRVLTRKTPDDELAQVLQLANRRVAQAAAFQRAGVTGTAAAQALDPRPLAIEPQEGSDDEDARGGFAFAAVLILYGQLLTFGFWVASGVVEEKASRVVEVVLATIRPSQLLAGKVIGLGLLGFVQLLAIAVVGVAAATAAGSLELSRDIVSAALLALVWFVLGYAFYACAFACAGALVPRQEELQASTTPLTIVILVAFFASFQVLDDPSGTLAKVSSFIPVTAPMTMPPRIALGEASTVEIVGAIVVTLVATALLIPLAARIYSGAVLRTGSSVKLREAWRAAGR